MDETCPIKYFINECDVTDGDAFEKSIKTNLGELSKDFIDFFIAHPPYWDIIKFTDSEQDLSQIKTLDLFLKKFTDAVGNAFKYLRPRRYFAVVMGDVYKNSEVVPLAFYAMNAIKSAFDVKLKGCIIKNIEGNRGKLGVNNIWHTRTLRSDYYIFKHEYIFVFKKE